MELKPWWIAVVLLGLLSVSGPAGEPVPAPFSSLVESGITELATITESDAREICRELAETLRGEDFRDVALLRDLAHDVLPVLEADKESRPFAAWLRARLDELEVAEKLRADVPPPIEPMPFPPPIHPSAIQVRKAWQKLLTREPVTPRVDGLVRKLKPIFRSERVPTELVWLAEVESGFDAKAVSPSGAAGLFQLMPETARFLKLTPNERFAIEPSGRAAAQYLRYLQTKFQDWPLTLAAYNAGEGRVRRLMEKRGAKTFDAIATGLPVETQLYVPKVETLIQRREGVSLAELGKHGTE